MSRPRNPGGNRGKPGSTSRTGIVPVRTRSRIAGRTRAPVVTKPPVTRRPLPRKDITKTAGPGASAAHKPARPSKLPLVAFLALTLVALGVTSAALMIHILTGGRQTSFTQAELDQELVAVEPQAGTAANKDMSAEDAANVATGADEANLSDIAQPNIIDLSGDPIVVKRRNLSSRQIVKLGGDALQSARPLKLVGNVFRLTDSLEPRGESLPGAVTGSQLGFAFAQYPTGPADENQPAGNDGGFENATVITVSADAGEAQLMPARTTVIKTVESETTLSAFLVANGFSEPEAKAAERFASDQMHLAKLDKGYGVAAEGFLPDRGASAYVPAQIALYSGSEFIAAMAMTDNGTYAMAENPWYGQDVFRSDVEGGNIARQRLMDAIYGSTVRNNISTSVAGEIILMLSRSFDLEQPITGNETMTVLFSSKPRDPKTGLGKILYVRIDGGSKGKPMECFVFRPGPDSAFECITGSGRGPASGNMVTPVRGVMTAKFGPVIDKVTRKRRFNPGIEWTAPPGSPVVAAYAGKVIFDGVDGKNGNTVKLAHDDGSITVYAYLNSFAPNLVEGKYLRAGQRLGTVGHPANSDEPLLFFEQLRDNQPVNPFGEYQDRIETGGAIEKLVYRITTIESANNCKAANPLSSAVGLGQFISSTWLRIIKDLRPDLMAGRSRDEILALRTDCDLALAMTKALTRENAAYIRAAGYPVTPGSLYLAHFLGPGQAAKALGSSRALSVADVMGANVVQANPFLEGKDVGWMIDWAARKMAGKGKAPPVSSGRSQMAFNTYAGNKAFNQYREIITALLN